MFGHVLGYLLHTNTFASIDIPATFCEGSRSLALQVRSVDDV